MSKLSLPGHERFARESTGQFGYGYIQIDWVAGEVYVLAICDASKRGPDDQHWCKTYFNMPERILHYARYLNGLGHDLGAGVSLKESP